MASKVSLVAHDCLAPLFGDKLSIYIHATLHYLSFSCIVGERIAQYPSRNKNWLVYMQIALINKLNIAQA